ncbi:MAG: cobalamin-dependent protein [Candidatus Sumerlaeaceae bacterium]|nr:cobalamin-dependent protein [Candidatus Sumerlaeaceae bacterium]
MDRECAKLIRGRLAQLAPKSLEIQYDKQKGFWEKFGEAGRQKGLEDSRYHFLFLAEAIEAGDPSIFLDYVHWLNGLFAGLRFPEDALSTCLVAMRDALQNMFSMDAMRPALELLESALAHLPAFVPPTDSYISGENPQRELALAYLEKLLQGDRRGATELITRAADAGISVRNLYLNVFQPVQHEVGRLWQTGAITVAQEHFCTACTQLVISQLYPRLFAEQPSERKGRAVVTAVAGELHELGARMVADFLEMDGWDTYYIGANTPVESFIATIEKTRPSVVGISCTIALHLSSVREITSAMAAHGFLPTVKILVGGRPFIVSPNLVQSVGAHATAPNAQAASLVAAQLWARN